MAEFKFYRSEGALLREDGATGEIAVFHHSTDSWARYADVADFRTATPISLEEAETMLGASASRINEPTR